MLPSLVSVSSNQAITASEDDALSTGGAVALVAVVLVLLALIAAIYFRRTRLKRGPRRENELVAFPIWRTSGQMDRMDSFAPFSAAITPVSTRDPPRHGSVAVALTVGPDGAVRMFLRLRLREGPLLLSQPREGPLLLPSKPWPDPRDSQHSWLSKFDGDASDDWPVADTAGLDKTMSASALAVLAGSSSSQKPSDEVDIGDLHVPVYVDVAHV